MRAQKSGFAHDTWEKVGEENDRFLNVLISI
jgi:hypothetical protein